MGKMGYDQRVSSLNWKWERFKLKEENRIHPPQPKLTAMTVPFIKALTPNCCYVATQWQLYTEVEGRLGRSKCQGCY